MTLFDVREPFSTWSHALGLLLSIPASIFLLRKAGNAPWKRLGLLIYGIGLVACYLGSTVYHAVPGSPEELEFYERLDHVGIHLLIAGTYTPLALTLLAGRWRFGTLGTVWSVTAVATVLLLVDRRLPPILATCEYLILGWGAVFCCLELTRRISTRALRWLVLGGLFYTAGAIINVTHWPVIWPGVMDYHGFFHLWVLAGSAAHYWFMWDTVIPHAARAPSSGPFSPSESELEAASTAIGRFLRRAGRDGKAPDRRLAADEPGV